ncbi:MAG: hypothetical protein K1W41_12105 [Lachnospiraceae bacterium]
MYKKQTYITGEERENCKRVTDAFADLFENEDLIVLDAGRFGFIKLQYFKFPFGFDTILAFYDCKSLFDDLWKEWLYTQLLNYAADTPMEEMDFPDILKCLPKDTRKKLLGKRLLFAEKTGIENLLEKNSPDLWSEEYMKTWSQDWEHFDWAQVRAKLRSAEEKDQEGGTIDKADIGISLDELKEYFEWLHDTQPEFYSATILEMALKNAGILPQKAYPSENAQKHTSDLS